MIIEITTHADERRRFLDTETGVETFQNHQDGHYVIMRPEFAVKVDTSDMDAALTRTRWALERRSWWAFFKTFVKENW